MATPKRTPPSKPAQPAPPQPAQPAQPSPGTPVLTKISASAGIIAAMVLAVLLNVLVARHYRRWDWTRGGLYTLSDATVQTLRSLEEPVNVYVLLSAGDPLNVSVRHLLQAYSAETTRLQVQYTDPDDHPAEFLAVQQRFGVVAGKTDDGQIVTDAVIIVARGERPHYLTARDLVVVEDEEDMRSRPQLEQALTGAIRSVLTTDRPRACFTGGHGERPLDAGGTMGLAPLRDRLHKNNFDVVQLGEETDHDDDHEAVLRPKTPTAQELAACRLLVVAAPSEPVPPAEIAAYRRYIEQGGSALVVAGPVPDTDDRRYLELGLDDLLALAGVRLEKDFIFELDPGQRSPQGHGETFLPTVRPHPITEGLIQARKLGLEPVITIGSTLRPAGASGNASAAPVALLETSAQAFGMKDFFAWAKDPTAPKPTEGDNRGPLAVAYATELPRPAGATAVNGPRLVVVSSPSALFGANWQNPELRGTALFVDSAISWLAARPALLDIPDKPAMVAGLRVSEGSLASIFRYVVLFMPLAAALLGAAVYLARRPRARADRAPAPPEDAS
ncbi:GldG family protein [Chondromyces apiculatus]|uniref:Uncharacterized protein n=1 Tax=Chondromyces apiculatus DSM 436 TaxID=1192034 RepID=A0A017SYK1_9BACT|nr:GldG family protein [Chondromyces apiculatus]EYF02023.1 Hypothetical protein CAP_7502 [Chondromyces apiculatus DSM 436]